LNAKGEIAADRGRLIHALALLLGDQWDAFVESSPKARDLVPASHAFAAAVGFPLGNPTDVAFGSLPRFLALIQSFPTAAESDLSRFWGLDYRDRWRFDDGRRRLTLRMIHARLSHLPSDSALAVELNGGKALLTTEALLLMDQIELRTGQPHPARPLTAEQKAERDKKAADYAKAKAGTEARAAAHKKRSAIEAARENALRDLGRPAHAPQEET
jgi:hypothetical protein